VKIKRIEIAGFKSFADKAVLDFQQGVTGVVGPNGCGKSNIVDAIRWCMGEQSAKNLRGKAMEDVIFAGSDNRKPLGMAEVSLVFSTEDGRAPAKYLEFSEIQLTRRLFRDGESEYLINKTPCRLLDIAELFMDTGVGTRAYSIIEQGKIGQILHSRPEERRLLIEEAAGVTKYKVRKQLALRKIEATRQNLLRLGDLMGEIKRQLNALQRQAKKAEKFRECREELREIDLLFTLHQADSLRQQQQEAQQQYEALQLRLHDVQGAADAADSQVELQRIGMLDAERELNLQQEKLFSLRSTAAACENGLTYQRREQEGLEQRLAKLQAELEQLTDRRTVLLGEQERLAQHQQLTVRDLSTAEERLAELQDGQEEQEQGFEALSRGLEAQRRELFAATGEAAQYRTRREEAHKRLMGLGERLERQQREQGQLAEQVTGQQQQLGRVQEESGLRLQEQQAVVTELAQLEEEELLLKSRLQELEQQVRKKREALSADRSRLTSLQELEAQFAGYGQGVRALLSASPLREQLGGMLADCLRVPQEYEVAVEAVLAERLQAVVCSDTLQAQQALDYLRTEAAGRAQLAAPRQELPVPRQIAGAVPLLSLVEPDQRAVQQIRCLLAPVQLVETLQQALQLSVQYPDQTLVTRTGEVVAADGTISGGSLEPVQGGIIHKKREIRELEEQVAAQEASLALDQQELNRLAATIQELALRLQGLRSDKHRLELQLAGLQKDCQQLDAELGRLQERISLQELERCNLEEEQAALQEEQAAVAVRQEEAEQLAARLEQEVKRAQAELEGKRLMLAAGRESLTAQRVTVATLKEQLESHQRSAKTQVTQLSELDQRMAADHGEQQQATGQLAELMHRIAGEELRLQTLLADQISQETQLQAVRGQYETTAAQLAEVEQAARSYRQERETVREQYAGLALKVSSLGLQREHLEQSLHDRHRLTLTEVQEKVGSRILDEAAARGRQVELERLVEELGEVNLMAIEEYAGMEQRHGFLAAQKDDLEESLQDLQQAINRINRTTRKRFLETFTLVNEKFQEVFPRLFCGGKAELRLTDEQDLLETGIEIIVQPPGKKLSNVMLLSGGEKALTAVALIFAIFLIKPTPFCLLDEVDAPLDDANIGRFNEMVREMSAISQFIIITHNKATMAVADTLYGITMEEPGASRLVSVRLH
jgi:chromosome segregation protein